MELGRVRWTMSVCDESHRFKNPYGLCGLMPSTPWTLSDGWP